jgi:hypothetical protein
MVEGFQIPDGFKVIPGYEDYAINEYGVVMRVVKATNNLPAGKILKQNVDRYGYKRLTLHMNGFQSYHTIHRLVALVYLGQSTLTVNHIDGNKLNNHFSNLEYCTIQDNLKHAQSTGLKARGSRVNTSKLSSVDVKLIRHLYSQGATQVELAQKFNVSQPNIGHIVRKDSWKHVT